MTHYLHILIEILICSLVNQSTYYIMLKGTFDASVILQSYERKKGTMKKRTFIIKGLKLIATILRF